MHWLKKAASSKRKIEFRNNIEGAINALNANINDDFAKIDDLGFGTTVFNLLSYTY